MNVEITQPAPVRHGETAHPSKRAESSCGSAELGNDASDVSTEVDPAQAQDLALWTTLCAAPVTEAADDADTQASPVSPPATELPLTALEQLNAELAAWVDTGAHGELDTCSFDLELPGFGRLQGRLSIRRDRADLELHAMTPGMATALRARRHELQQGIDEALGEHDVTLFIA